MENIIIVKGKGENCLFDLRSQLSNFVLDNWQLLYEGAVRLGCNIPEDYYTCQRIQINSTRLHATRGLKYADGHKYSDEYAPTEVQLRQTISDIQTLIDAAAENIPAPFRLEIIEMAKKG